ncbi:uncharacterized protein LOC127280686 isoform X2 [Leptopilina boulardi]|uniref:uncharacterized protein LOC127280686 isoform X2 n=1 Tax=Leptopilina boulardi TaxID=63433 RepID=UPI0021F5829D|nr:uncharacterized protein LOC127280686 isoform X2 [Leptopilina boulardi]
MQRKSSTSTCIANLIWVLCALVTLCCFFVRPALGAPGPPDTGIKLELKSHGEQKFGDSCKDDSDCGFDGSECHQEQKKCYCRKEFTVTNHIDKCGMPANIDELCYFHEQCQAKVPKTECRDGLCSCVFDKIPRLNDDNSIECIDLPPRGGKKIGDDCKTDSECGFYGAHCSADHKKCFCKNEFLTSNQIDKCGNPSNVNESCDFNEQCEMKVPQTECRDGRCICIFEKIPVLQDDGTTVCIAEIREPPNLRTVDPAMIGVLVGMALMFVIICVVLRLFSKARWRENRTIFNTPNARLMNVSLLKDNKLLHGQERRGSRASVRGPSRQPSMASLRAHSPNASQDVVQDTRITKPSLPGSRTGSRRGSRGSSGNASAVSNRSNKSPPNHNTPADPAMEDVAVKILEAKA